MKLFGFNRKGFLYIDNGNNLISQQTTSGESQMLNNYCTLMEYDNLDAANKAYEARNAESWYKEFQHQESMLNEASMYMGLLDEDSLEE